MFCLQRQNLLGFSVILAIFSEFLAPIIFCKFCGFQLVPKAGSEIINFSANARSCKKSSMFCLRLQNHKLLGLIVILAIFSYFQRAFARKRSMFCLRLKNQKLLDFSVILEIFSKLLALIVF